jgi:hypothetical protein
VNDSLKSSRLSSSHPKVNGCPLRNIVIDGKLHDGVCSETGIIPMRYSIGNLMLAAGWGSPSLRTTQSRLITSLRRPPALRSYPFECEFV